MSTPGATREARWARTPSAIELVTQNLGPNCSTAHSITASAGAPSSVDCAAYATSASSVVGTTRFTALRNNVLMCSPSNRSTSP
jgi:hypothetical protein